MPSSITASIVTYKHTIEDLEELLESLSLCVRIAGWIVVDNSAHEDRAASEQLHADVKRFGGRYVASGANLGFGKAHNIGVQELSDIQAEYHIYCNPDILFEAHVLPSLADEMDRRPDLGRIMPKVLYRDGRLQRLNKLLPTPADLALRRFFPHKLSHLLQRFTDRYELDGIYDREFRNVPFLSGCFIFMRHSVIRKFGGFNEMYFLYLEDTELSRVSLQYADNLYWPHVHILHGYQRGSYSNWRLTWVNIQATFLYFNRWGWFFDSERKRYNKAALTERDRLMQRH